MVFALLLLLQRGDLKNEPQPPLPDSILKRVPPAPVVPAEKAVFHLAEGFRVDLVASEPLVGDPVHAAFDAQGRLWVVEMRGFWPALDGRGENDPVGKIVVLEDVDRDGRFDKRTIFLDGLIQPRSVGFAAGGVLVAEPPALWHCVDTDGDLKCDRKEVVDPLYAWRGNPEHLPNGLLTSIDNWIYNAGSTWRYRRVGGRWIRGHTRFRGQWGLTQDDAGRLYGNHNTTLLRGDLVPSWSPLAHSRAAKDVNIDLTKDQTLRPIRPNTGVNRGYRPGVLRDDGSMLVTQSACAPLVLDGQVFVCDPSANLVKRFKLEGIEPLDGPGEFLASADERFRPVHLLSGPDGALYVVDMYRGIIQHGAYMTSHLRREIVARGLDRPVGLGRIWRVSKDAPRATAPVVDLVRELASPIRWRRDTAQRLLVEGGRVVAGLRELAKTNLHALWTLEGLGALEGEAWIDELKGVKGPLLGPLDGLLESLDAGLQVPGARLNGLEADILERIMAEEAWDVETPARAAFVRGLAERLGRGQDGESMIAFLDLAAVQSTAARWRQREILKGLEGAGPPLRRSVGGLLLSEDPEIRALSARAWKVPPTDAPFPPPLTAEERARFDRGRRQFAASCAVCHMRSGLGEQGRAPSLVDSDFVTGPEQRLARVVLHGLKGPLRKDGRLYMNNEMPGVINLSTEEVAEILTYLRREWGHREPAVSPEAVRKIKADTEDREEPWTQDELLKIP
ncbi:MAG TPA: c-type cytochrome [Planctomycetota bacterium]